MENGGNGVHVETGESISALIIKRVTIADNAAHGIFGGFSAAGVRLIETTITANAVHGVGNADVGGNLPCRVKLVKSDVTGNGLAATCGVSETCADVTACAKTLPVLKGGSSCNTSYVLRSGFPGTSWGVCALD